MAHENSTVVLGIPLPSTDPVFLAIVGIHVLLGLAAVIAGAVAMLSNKARGRHSTFGTIYFRCLSGVFVTMSALSFMRWTADYHLFVLGTLSFAAAIAGRTAVRRCWRRWPQLHLTGMGVSYTLMLTAFYVDNGPNLPLWSELPWLAFWVLDEIKNDAGKLAAEIWIATTLVDKLGLFTTEVYQQSREDTIRRQNKELLELSTPVVQLWDKILALPLIGTLDSERTQTVMENLLNSIVHSGAEIAIIDITGVPTVDTLVAQHLIKTVSAARLMGADCIISGIRPQIAQTIVHLGLQLDVISKATMADAFALALRRTGQVVGRASDQADLRSLPNVSRYRS